MTVEKPTSFGKYHVLRPIAQGGMAEVFLASFTGLAGFSKLVAIKRIRPHLASTPEALEMFLDEARLAARLNHGSIVQIFDLEQIDGQHLIVMEYVHGKTLFDVLRAAGERHVKLSLDSFVTIAHGMLSGLDVAHSHRDNRGIPTPIVHRDVSPQNLLISYDGLVKLADFGIAKAEGCLHKTQTGFIKGKFAYMSPEQQRGEPLDPRSDIYSAGVVMYEMLVGRNLFAQAIQDPFRPVETVFRKAIVPPSTQSTGYPEELDEIIMRMLSVSVRKRYQSCQEIISELSEVTALTPNPAELASFMKALFPEAPSRDQLLIDTIDTSVNQTRIVAEKQADLTSDANLIESVRSVEATPASSPQSFDGQLSALVREHQRPGHNAIVLPPPTVAPENPVMIELPKTRAPLVVAITIGSAFLVASALLLFIALRKSKPDDTIATATLDANLISTETGAANEPDAAIAQIPPRDAETQHVAQPALDAEAVVVEHKPINDTNTTSTKTGDTVKTKKEPSTSTRTKRSETTSKKPEPKRAVSRPEPKRGKVALTTSSPVDVYWKGEKVGRTPLSSLDLPVGKQTLQLKHANGDIDLPVTVTVKANQTTRLNLNLSPATIHVNAVPWAKVYINNKFIDETPLKPMKLAPGRYLIKLVFPHEGKTLQYDKRLEAKGGQSYRVVYNFLKGASESDE